MEQYIVEGNTPVKAVLLVQERDIIKIVVDKKKKDHDTAFVLRQAIQRSIPIKQNSRQVIDELAQGKTRGGLLALCGERRLQTLWAVVERDSVFPILIEGVEDPFNLGYMLRTLYVAGCDGTIVPSWNQTTAAGVVTKAGAGTSGYLNLIVVTDMETLPHGMKQADVQLMCAQRKDAVSLYDCALLLKLCLAIDGEMYGSSKRV